MSSWQQRQPAVLAHLDEVALALGRACRCVRTVVAAKQVQPHEAGGMPHADPAGLAGRHVGGVVPLAVAAGQAWRGGAGGRGRASGPCWTSGGLDE